MANKELKQWLVDNFKDPNWGRNQEIPIKAANGNIKKPDWGYLYPNGKAIIMEDKETGDVSLDKALIQLSKYEAILNENGYTDVIKIAVKDNGTKKEVKVFRNDNFLSDELQTLNYYEQLIGAKKQIDISKEIFKYTQEINELLHHEFKINHLQDRMLFTGCALVASKYSKGTFEQYEGIEGFKSSVVRKINSQFTKPEIKVKKINQLTSAFNSINIGANPTNQLIQDLCEKCNAINTLLKDNPFCDIDIMNIFFTEFNRYRGKSESGQVFTKDEYAQLMAELLDIQPEDHILDPCCGSASLLIASSMFNNKNFDNIFGNDFDMSVLRLSYINMLLHNDGVTNLVQMDARDTTPKAEKKEEKTFIQWIKESKITKVIANPPYEKTFAIDILENILDNIEKNGKVVWLMPNNKLEKKSKQAKEILKKHTLTDIIFLGDIFYKTGCGDVSLFLFTTGQQQGDKKVKCWHVDNPFETVKNIGYVDTKGKWPTIKEQFLKDFKEGKFDKEIDPSEKLSYEKEIEVVPPEQKDFEMTLLQYRLFQTGEISSQNTVQSVLDLIMTYSDKNQDSTPDKKEGEKE